MITFTADTRTFNLLTRHSYYAFQADADGHLVHLGWGLRPADAGPADRLDGRAGWENPGAQFSFYTQYRPDEILTFGEVISYQVTLKASFAALGQPLQPGEAAHLPVRDLRLRYAGHSLVTDAQPGLAPAHGQPVANPAPRETLRVRLTDPVQPFTVVACYRLTPEHDLLERWCELENTGQHPVTLDVCQFASLHLPNGATELTYLSGAWANEYNQQRTRLLHGTQVIENRSLQTGHNTNPVFLLNQPEQAGEDSGAVYFGQLAYSGAWQLAFEQLPNSAVRVHGGYNPFDFQLVLAPGERHATPAFVAGVCPDGWGGASRRLHAHALERVLPAPAGRPPYRPVLYNSWEATTFNLSYASQAALARRAAGLGVELFCVDDGWFGARRDDLAGLGDWVVRPEAFPEGLEALVAEVHRLGMQFGLWVEPEMVNPDSDLYRAHPDWVLHFPGRPRTQARNQLILDFGRPEVVEHIFSVLDTLVTRYAVAFFKWDMNRQATEPGSAAGQALWHQHVAGVYSLMDRLRARHPGLDIESCSGGGGRVDLGILGRVDQVWTSDNTDALDRVLIQEGFSLAYPARTMEAWVTHHDNAFTERATPLRLRFDVAMRGALGIGTNLAELSAEELAEYAGYIAFYKRLRPIIQGGRLYRLQRLAEFGASVIEYVLPDGREAVYSIVVRDYRSGVYRPAAPLRGLRSSQRYRVLDREGAEVHHATGYALMTAGLPGQSAGPVGWSQTLHIQAVD
jgi:alpha-galactosidase